MDHSRQPPLQPDAIQPLVVDLDSDDWFWISPDDLIQSYCFLTKAEIDDAVREFEQNLAALMTEIDADTSLG